MSKATKRKHVTREVLEDYILPDENQQILKILGGRGNNLHEAQTSVGERFLISMPTRFRKNVWIKRGDYVLADPITEGDKVKGEIVAILYPKQIKYIKEEKLWPPGFDNASYSITDAQGQDNGIDELTRNLKDATLSEDVGNAGSPRYHDDISNSDNMKSQNRDDDRDDDSDDDYSSEDDDDDLFVNTNRPTVTYFYLDSSSEEDEEVEEEEEESDEEENRGAEKGEEGYEHGSDNSADR